MTNGKKIVWAAVVIVVAAYIFKQKVTAESFGAEIFTAALL